MSLMLLRGYVTGWLEERLGEKIVIGFYISYISHLSGDKQVFHFKQAAV